MPPTQQPSWLNELTGRLKRRVAIVCVGNRLNGDDAAGPVVADSLQMREPWKVFDAGVAPENWIGPVCSFRPELVVVVDAVGFGEPPGSIACWNASDLAGTGFSTHYGSLSLTLDVVKQETGADALVIGIQPETVQAGADMCPEVRNAVNRVADKLTDLHARLESVA